MNKDRATENRIEWTTEGLNVFLPIYEDIQDLQIKNTNRAPNLSTGICQNHLSNKYITCYF